MDGSTLIWRKLSLGTQSAAGSRFVETLLMVIEQDPVPPRWLDPGIDRELEMICLKCLQKLPAQRYTSAGDLARDLEAFVAGGFVSMRQVGQAECAWLAGTIANERDLGTAP